MNKTLTLEIKARLARRLQNADSDQAVRRVVNEAKKYGLDLA